MQSLVEATFKHPPPALSSTLAVQSDGAREAPDASHILHEVPRKARIPESRDNHPTVKAKTWGRPCSIDSIRRPEGIASAGFGKSRSGWPGASLSGAGIWTRWLLRLQKLREVHPTPWSCLRWVLARYGKFCGSLQSREVSCYSSSPHQRNISRKNTTPPAHRCGRRIVVFFKKYRRPGNHR